MAIEWIVIHLLGLESMVGELLSDKARGNSSCVPCPQSAIPNWQGDLEPLVVIHADI